MTQSVVTIFYGGCSMQGLLQIFFELTSFCSYAFCFSLTVELVSLEENISFRVLFFWILIQVDRSVKITRDVCVRRGEGAIGGHSLSYGQLRGHLRVIPVLTGNLQTSQALPVSAYHKTSGYQSFDLGDRPRQSTESRALWTL